MNRRGFLAALLAAPVADITSTITQKDSVVVWGPKTPVPKGSALGEFLEAQLQKRRLAKQKFLQNSQFGKLGNIQLVTPSLGNPTYRWERYDHDAGKWVTMEAPHELIPLTIPSINVSST